MSCIRPLSGFAFIAVLVAAAGGVAAASRDLVHGFRIAEKTIWRTESDYEMATVFDGEVKGSMVYHSSRLESALVRHRYRDGSATLEMRVSDEVIDGEGEPAERARARSPMRAKIRFDMKVARDGRLLEHKARDVPDGFGSVDGLLEELRPMRLSGRPVAEGATWTDNSSLDIGGIVLKVTASYEVTAVRGDEVDISSSAEVTCEMPDVPPEATAICTGSGSGKIVFDLAHGRLTRSEEELTVILGMEAHDHRIETRLVGRSKRGLDKVEKGIPAGLF